MENSDILSVFIIFLCVAISAFFSAAETSITSLGSLKARHLLDIRGKTVSQLNLWLKHPSRVLTTILIFNTVVNILASAVATELAARYFHSRAIGIATGIVTLLILVFGEIIPKSFAKAMPEPIAIATLKLIQIIYWIMFPVIWFFSELAAKIIVLLGAKEKKGPPITEAELEFLVNVGEKAGVIEETKQEMISGVFGFDETRVREVMTPRTDIRAIELHSSFSDAVRIANESGFSRIPVFEGRIDNIVGMLLAKDLLQFTVSGKDGGPTQISQMMREVFFVPESKLIMDVFKDLKRNKKHMAIVIDEYGGTAGIVTLEDILEEIVGEIQDEFDSEEAEIIDRGNGVYDVQGSLNIEDFLEFFELGIRDLNVEQDAEADTIGGLLTHILGDLPKVGKTITIGPLKLEVTDMSRHRIRRVKVRKETESQLSKSEQSSDVETGRGK